MCAALAVEEQADMLGVDWEVASSEGGVAWVCEWREGECSAFDDGSLVGVGGWDALLGGGGSVGEGVGESKRRGASARLG